MIEIWKDEPWVDEYLTMWNNTRKVNDEINGLRKEIDKVIKKIYCCGFCNKAYDNVEDRMECEKACFDKKCSVALEEERRDSIDNINKCIKDLRFAVDTHNKKFEDKLNIDVDMWRI